MSKLRVAALQLEMVAGEEPRGRVQRVLEELDQAPTADLIVLPELWDVGYFAFDRYQEEARELSEGPIGAVGKVARERECTIVAGSVIERNDGLLHNTVTVLDGKGQIIGVYRKKHLFGYESKERDLLSQGDETIVCETPVGRIGLATCFDLRFPEQFAEMRRMGADLFVVPSAWPAKRRGHWEILTRARAIENQTPLVACNCAGVNESIQLAASSVILSAIGDELASAAHYQLWLTAAIDHQATQSWRREFPISDEALTP